MLDMWVVYQWPDDAPGAWVVRQWWVVPGIPEPVPGSSIECVSLQGAVAQIPPDKCALGRSPEDAPAIVGVWL